MQTYWVKTKTIPAQQSVPEQGAEDDLAPAVGEAHSDVVKVSSYALLTRLVLSRKHPCRTALSYDRRRSAQGSQFPSVATEGWHPAICIRGHIRAQEVIRIAILLMDSVEQAEDRFADSIPELTLDTTDKMGKEVVASLTSK